MLKRRDFVLSVGLMALTRPMAPTLAAVRTAGHVVLLGDSTLDNAAYVLGPHVRQQVASLLPPLWRVALMAREGAALADVRAQLGRLPADASHLVLSAGGNDVFEVAPVLDAKVNSVAEAFQLISSVCDRFRNEYAALLGQILALQLPTALCTIYEPRIADPVQRRTAAAGLAVFNDVITREAFTRGADCIDLRAICDQAEDFAGPIEPSVQGGHKIARAIAQFAGGVASRESRVIAR